MKGILSALLGLSLILSVVNASAQFVKTKDIEKMKKRTSFIVVKERPDKKIIKLLRQKAPDQVADYKQAIKQLNRDFPEVVKQYWALNGAITVEQKTEKEVARLRTRNNRNYIVFDCQSMKVKPGSRSRRSKYARTYTSSLSWKFDNKDLSVPVINMYFIENDVQYPFYIQNMSDRFPDYTDLAVGLRLATYVFTEQLGGRPERSMQQEIKHNAMYLKDKTLVLCKNWLDDDFVESMAKSDYPYPIRFVSKEELDELFKKDTFDGSAIAYIPAGVFSTFDMNYPSMEVNVPVVFDPVNGMPLCHTDISDEMFQAWGFSLIPQMGKSMVGFKKIRNQDIKNFAKSMKE
ncbi:hypothetical protein SAMN05518672_1011000 [Chitinophaga sp. CF118]|uniref:hypothetical protein n=1 Tax=Chitinophaga sp. CF118 TaxID=1884367 RepID=UPI0008ECEB84|nr:hypothetical protein [Chitinophaga sp. CF118]SFD19821.1 hypothetical protein SAMN05518672_1011000 [Chitinophaga sp. CF118]